MTQQQQGWLDVTDVVKGNPFHSQTNSQLCFQKKRKTNEQMGFGRK